MMSSGQGTGAALVTSLHQTGALSISSWIGKVPTQLLTSTAYPHRGTIGK